MVMEPVVVSPGTREKFWLIGKIVNAFSITLL